jgi:hypothetical protein
MSSKGERSRSGPETLTMSAARVVLVVGEHDRPQVPLHLGDCPVAFAEIHEVGAELLDSLRPDVVLSPLLARSFDCIDLAQILEAVGFEGAYRAMTPPLPAPDLVRREIRSLCPGVNFDLLQVPQDRQT